MMPMIGNELIGLESKPVLLKIKNEEMLRFAEAAGIRFNDQVPITFVGTLMHSNIGGIELPIPGMIHGEQKITYHRLLNMGDNLTYKRRVKDVYERVGKRGKLIFLVIESTGYDFSGELVFTCSSTLIRPVPEGEES